ncbi:SusD/RagB family nutrient-binding outer membrane lipoprotein [Christiangramia sabulilitoris]|uniref:SusD/RagB family nutrient-binding outer membrane lipoprotein n=1 Tax=Christiangramia sabulilitoris TaxID=2583991 RepID=A0A550I3Z7_9FLAO|nr:SusD/RagB family nutrient-binding outer membrane lipoprotein [Christiangramia sabulilitoris]TRO65702.1 SusD/RagB family nutrient-binding outer membrane lipoprotein [Christiangramia sabulilitoris]
MKTIKILIWIALISVSVSCEITDANVDPDNPSAELVNAGAIYPGMIAQTHRNSVALGGRIAGILVQHFDGLDAQQIAYDQYNIGESDIDDLWDFGLYGGGAMKDAFVIIQNNEGEISALAKLYMAANLGVATSAWGDIPYTEAFVGDQGNLNPSYDSQEFIYGEIQDLLTEAIDEGVASGVGAFAGAGSADNVDWEGVAHALKARYYLHLTSVNGASAAQNALTEIQQAFTSTAAQPDFVYSTPAQNANPWFLFDNDRPSTLGISEVLFDEMNSNDDPRLPFYTTDGESFAGIDGLFWGQASSPTPLISYWEVKFIEAEAIVRTGGSDDDALDALKEAVSSNMLYIGVEQSEVDSYVDGLSLSGSEDDKIQTIINEKWIALYGNAPLEAWVDFRRTGYPELTPNPDAVPSFNPSGVIPRRFLYPLSERQANLANYEAAIQAQGGHLLDDDLWAFPSN